METRRQAERGNVERREARCVLSDGTALRTILLLPAGSGPWPALLMRHPYDVSADERDGLIDVTRLAEAGFVVALQDVRGRFGSAGDFDPCRQEVADGAEAVAWLSALPECNGSVGMWGASYASDTQFSALMGGAPALKALAATVTPALSALDGFRFRGGVPELGSTLAWTHYAIAPDMISRIADAGERFAEEERWQTTEAAIAGGTACGAAALQSPRQVEAAVAWGLDRLRDPLDSPQHKAGKIVERMDAVDIPVLLIGGWFDVFLGSTLELYRRLCVQSRDRGTPAPALIVGPWSHSNMSGTIAGTDYGSSASAQELWREGGLTEQHVGWFARALMHEQPAEKPVHVFVMGSNRWVALEEFPPPQAEAVELFLSADGSLSEAPLPGARALQSDPAAPVPTRGGAVLLFGSFEAGPMDQTPLEARSDVLSWRTDPLQKSLTILGSMQAVIHLETTGTDADVVVRLCDEHPGGRSLVIADGVQRGSARDVDPVTGAGDRRPLTPGRDEEFVVDLWSTAHTFLPGHRMRVDIAPSSSPRWDVGTNAFEPGAGEAPPVAAQYTIRHGPAHPSRLIVQTANVF